MADFLYNPISAHSAFPARTAKRAWFSTERNARMAAAAANNDAVMKVRAVSIGPATMLRL
jgi:hypothetical protein